VHIQQVLASGGPSDLAGSWVANVMPLVTAASSASVNWDELVISDVSPGTDLTLHFAFTQPDPGLITGDALPGQNAAVVQLRSLTKGKRTRGRFYFPGIAEAGTTNALLTGAQLTAISNLASQLIVFYGPTGSQTSYKLVIFSPPTPPFKAKTPPPVHTNTLITPVNNTVLDTTIRTQRRRMIGVGR
jgi:hypothetical protein